jgi:hypothetical protein
MVTTADIIRLPYTPDLTQSGIDYACRSLNYIYSRMGGTPFSRLRRIVAGVAVELAFRRHLTEAGIPFAVRGATPFTEPDRYDVALGGHRCDVKSFLITRRPQIVSMRRDPGVMLGAPALIPSDQFASETRSDQDLYVFAFLSGLVAAAQEDIEMAREADQPVCLIHPLPMEWTRPQVWHPLELVLKSEGETPLSVEVGGQNAERDYITERVTLPPLERVRLESPFHSVACVRVESLPVARIGLHSAARRETYLVPPAGWGNIWIYGMEIWLAGYVTHEEFRRRASFVEQGSQVFQYKETRTKNLAVPVMDLHPLGELLERVRVWEMSRT